MVLIFGVQFLTFNRDGTTRCKQILFCCLFVRFFTPDYVAPFKHGFSVKKKKYQGTDHHCSVFMLGSLSFVGVDNRFYAKLAKSVCSTSESGA